MDKLKTGTTDVEYCKFDQNGQVCGLPFSFEIVDELNQLYRNRLVTENPEQRMQTMEEWIKDLLDQNAALVKLAQELENESIKRVDIVERMQHMTESGGKVNENNSLNKKVQCLEDLNASLKDCLKKKEDEISEMTRTIESLLQQTTELEKTESTLKKNESKVNDLSKCMKEKEETIMLMNGQMEKLKETVQNLEKELKCSGLSKQESLLQVTTMQKEMRCLKEHLRERDDVIRRYQTEFDRLSQEIRTKEQQNLKMCEMEKEMNDLKMDLSQHLRTVERLRTQNAELMGLLCNSPPRPPNGSNPDQRQVQNLRGSDISLPTTQQLYGMSPCVKFSFEEVARLKEKSVCLEKTKSAILDVWNTMRKFDVDEYERCTQELDALIRNLTVDHDALKCICHNYDKVFEQINTLSLKPCPNEYAFSSVETCLSNVLQSVVSASSQQQQQLDFEVWPVLIQKVESNIAIASNLLKDAKSAVHVQKELLNGFEFGKIRQAQRTLNELIANEENFIKKLTSMKKVQESLSKNVLDKLDVLETKLISHQKVALSMKSEVEMIVDNFEKSEKAIIPSKSFTTVSSSSSASFLKTVPLIKQPSTNESRNLKELFIQPERARSKSLNTFDSRNLNKIELTKEIEIKGAKLQKMINALCGHVKTIVVQFIGVISQFENSHRVEDLLRLTKRELSSAHKMISESKLTQEMISLNLYLSRAEGEIHRLSEIIASVSSAPIVRSTEELRVVPMMEEKVLQMVVDFLKSVKAAQRQDNESLKNYCNQIEQYKAKIEEMGMKIRESSLYEADKVSTEVQTLVELSDVDENEESKTDVINRLQTELDKVGKELERITAMFKNLEKEKQLTEENNQKMSEEFQTKVTHLQSQLQAYKEKEEHQQQQALTCEVATSNELFKMSKLNREFRERFEKAEHELKIEKEEMRKLKELLVCKDEAIRQLKKGVYPQENLYQLAWKFDELVLSYEDKCKANDLQSDKIDELEDEILTLRQHLTSESKNALDLSKENKTLKENLNNLQALYDREVQSSYEKCKYAGERVSLMQKITSLKYEKEVLLDDIKYAKQFALELKKMNDDLIKENDRLKEEHEQMAKYVELQHPNDGSSGDTASAELTSALKQRDGTIAYLLEERKNMISLITKLRNILDAVNRQSKTYKKRWDSLSSTLGCSDSLTVTSGEL